MNDYYSLDRLMDVLDEIDNREPITGIRRKGLQDLLNNNGKDYRTYPGQVLVEELYVAIFCYEE